VGGLLYGNFSFLTKLGSPAKCKSNKARVFNLSFLEIIDKIYFYMKAFNLITVNKIA